MFMFGIADLRPKPIKIAVGGTNIFARGRGDTQVLVYGMNIAASDPVAMVLPLPTPAGVAQDAVRFIDLRGYPKLFVDLNECFPPVMLPVARGGGFGGGGPPVQTLLKVHDAGDFEASFVPTLSDVDRLDSRFRLPAEVWDALPQYADWSFAVFQLRDVAEAKPGWLAGLRRPKPKTVHPMALEFPRRWTDRLFFPTVHVHDGLMHDTDDFDHALFWQNEPNEQGAFEPAEDVWPPAAESPDVAWANVDIEATGGLVAGELPVSRRVLRGSLPNRDHWVRRAE